ncbi:MAG: hypothetical protein EOP53_18355 [Sphingobacteriales bacterium]|nr:MAG: hypothetical protein EOP53_18355 [Sphingobacteriales bacterium]
MFFKSSDFSAHFTSSSLCCISNQKIPKVVFTASSRLSTAIDPNTLFCFIYLYNISCDTRTLFNFSFKYDPVQANAAASYQHDVKVLKGIFSDIASHLLE